MNGIGLALRRERDAENDRDNGDQKENIERESELKKEKEWEYNLVNIIQSGKISVLPL